MVLVALTADERVAYRQALHSVYTKRIVVDLLDRNGNVIEPLTHAFQGGEVIVDADADVTRASTITVLDPAHEYGFDSDTYQGGKLDLTRQLRIWWVMYGGGLGRRISVPVFTGPLTRARRDGSILTLEGQGKEVRGLTPSRRTLTIKKGALRTDAIKVILAERMGETRFDAIPHSTSRLPNDLVVGPKDPPLAVIKRVAGALNCQFFYDAAGVPRLRPFPTRPTWVFESGPGGSITGPISTEADLQSVKNHVRVVGAIPKGKKTPVSAQATADRSHPLSPWSLGGDDSPMWLIEEVENENLRTQRECQDLAQKLLADGLRLLHDVSFNAAPVPHLEPMDMAQVSTQFEAPTTRLRKFTLPLGLGGDMTVGWHDPYSLPLPNRKKGR